MSIFDYQFVLACVNPPRVWNFYPTLEAAEADRERVNASDRGVTYEPMTYDAYKLAERAVWLADGEREITREKFWQMLEVLPPMNWTRKGDFESFLMSEFTSGSFTEQYARRGEKYYSKTVDATDRSTWMKENA